MYYVQAHTVKKTDIASEFHSLSETVKGLLMEKAAITRIN